MCWVLSRCNCRSGIVCKFDFMRRRNIDRSKKKRIGLSDAENVHCKLVISRKRFLFATIKAWTSNNFHVFFIVNIQPDVLLQDNEDHRRLTRVDCGDRLDNCRSKGQRGNVTTFYASQVGTATRTSGDGEYKSYPPNNCRTIPSVLYIHICILCYLSIAPCSSLSCVYLIPSN